jgi:hypothetical protein
VAAEQAAYLCTRNDSIALQLAFSNYHKPKHDLVSTINFRLKDINANPGRYGPHAPPLWSANHFLSLFCFCNMFQNNYPCYCVTIEVHTLLFVNR